MPISFHSFLRRVLFAGFATLLLSALSIPTALSQLSGAYAIPGSAPSGYTTVEAAIADLNSSGISGPVIFNVATGHTETFTSPAAGRITASGTPSNTITFRKSGSGANPLITAAVGISTGWDGIIVITGGDYITIDGIDLQESSGNTTTTTQMEWGYALVKRNTGAPFDGCQYVTITNCAITLNKANTASTGIYCGNHVATSTATLTITASTDAHNNNRFFGNTISNVYTGIRIGGFAASSPYALYDQNNEIGKDGANIITNYGGGSSTAYGVYAIYQNNLKIQNNTITSATGTATTLYGVFVSTSTSSNIDIIANSITIHGGATTSSIYGINNAGGSTASSNTVNINGNTVQNCTYAAATSGSFFGIVNSGTATTVNINNNTVSGNTLPGTGAFYGLQGGGPVNLSINGNQVYGNLKSGASGTMYCVHASTAIVTFSGNSIYNNSIPNTSGTSAAVLYGYYNLSSPTVENLFDNQIHDLTIGGVTTSTSCILNGIYTYTIASATKSVYGNSIYALSSHIGTVAGIRNNAGTTVNIYSNRVYDLSCTAGTTDGLNLTTTSNTNVYNNYISDLRAPSSTNANAVTGINYISTTSGNALNAYFNTVYLNAAAGGSGFGSSAVLVSSANPTVNFRNNIFLNVSASFGTGLTVAYRRGNTTLTSYASTSDNNCFYAGTPGTGNLIFYDGSNSDQTVITYRSRVAPRDAASFSELPPFVNTTTVPYNLHLLTTTATSCESGGSAIGGIDTDFDGDFRYGHASYAGAGSAPDVGADEGDFTGRDIVPPSMSYVPVQGGAAAATCAFAGVVITDVTGVDTGSGTRPRVYYKKGGPDNQNVWNNNTSATPGWKWVEANGAVTPFDFTINYSLVEGGSVAVGDTIMYFVTAQDLVTPPNVGIRIGVFAAQPSSVSLTSTAFPIGGQINQYIIMQSVGDTLTVGGANARFPALKDAFDFLNTSVLTGDVNILVTGNTVESATASLNPVAVTPSNAQYTVRVRPSGGAFTVSGSISGALIKLNGADRVSFDGLNTGGNSLAFVNNSTAANSAVFWISSQGTGAGATNDTIRNCDISGGVNTTSSVYGIFAAGASISSSGTGNDNDGLVITGNTIRKAYHGIYIAAAIGGENDGLVISGNVIGAFSTAEQVNWRGITLRGVTNASVTRNTVFNMSNTLGSTITAIEAGQDVNGGEIGRNLIYGIRNTSSGGWGAYGINFSSTTNVGNVTVSNNVIYDLLTANYSSGSTFIPAAIRFAGGTNCKVYHNSVNMFGTQTVGSTACISAALMVTAGAVTGLDVRNNVFANTMQMSSNSKAYAIYAASGVAFAAINNNDYHASGAFGVLGYFGGDISSLSAWQAATLQDANSLAADPQFNDVDNLIPVPGSPLLAAGTPLAAVAVDFNGAGRSSTAPTIGAYETSVDNSGPVIFYAAPGNDLGTTSKSFGGVAITDPSGVNGLSGTRPRIYYKKSGDADVWNDNSSATAGWKFAEASGPVSPFDFTIDYSRLSGGSVTAGDTLQYFVVAQDMASTPNVSINSGIFNAQPSGVALTAAAFPIGGSVNTFRISIPVSGSYTVGSGGTYSTLKLFFDLVNDNTVTGNVTVSIVGDAAETAAAELDEWIEHPAHSNFTMTIQPSGGARTISGSIAGALIKLNGADRVTINGLNSGGNSLTLSNTSASTNTAVVWLAGLGTGAGAARNTIRNCSISAGSGTVNPTFGIYAAGSAISSTGSGEDNDSLTISGNTIEKAYYGIYAAGTASGPINDLVISQNVIGSNSSGDRIGKAGIQLQQCVGVSIDRNEVFNIVGTVGNPQGIVIGAGSMDCEVTRNSIRDIVYTGTGGYGGKGIDINTGSASSAMTVANNVVANIRGDGWSSFASDAIVGIRILGNTGGINLFYNSVNLTGAADRAGETKSAALYVVSTATNLNLRNNIFSNSIVNNSYAAAKAYTIYSDAAASAFTTIDYNDYYGSGPQAVLGYIGSADKAALGDWQSAVMQDANSISFDPFFATVTNLQPELGSLVLGGGTPIAGTTGDHTGAPRSSTAPSIGAFESGSGDTRPPTIVHAPLPNTSSASNRTFTARIVDGAGVPTSGALLPRVYYRKGAGSWYSTAASLSSGGGNDGTWSFVIDYSSVGGVTLNDVISYYIIAQDNLSTPLIASYPPGVTATDVNNVGSHPSAPFTYTVITGFQGAVAVGPGHTFESLTRDGGLFQTMNSGIFSGNVTVTVDSSTVEDGTHALNEWAEEGVGGYTLTIQPDAGVRTLEGVGVPSGVPMLKLNGADRVTIDGGAGKRLLLRNTNSTPSNTGPALSFDNNSRNCELKNCILESNSAAATGIISFGSNGLNHKIIISANDIRDATAGSIGEPVNAVYSGSYANSQVTIQDNNIYNWSGRGIYLASIRDSCIISGNSLYATSSRSSARDAVYISLRNNGSAVISGNHIGGTAPQCAGSVFTETGSNDFSAIHVAGSSSAVRVSIQGNVIRNMSFTGASGSINLIFVEYGKTYIGDVTGNTIGHSTAQNGISTSRAGECYMIRVSAYESAWISNNTISNITSTQSGSSGFGAIYRSYIGGLQRTDVTDNTVSNLYSASGNTGTTHPAANFGIISVSPSDTLNVKRNTVFNLKNTGGAGSAATLVQGIYVNGSTVGAMELKSLDRNKIYNLENTSTGPGQIIGLRIAGGYMTAANNMVSLSNGANTNDAHICGIWNNATAQSRFVYNSVHIAGSQSGGSSDSYGLLRSTQLTFLHHNNLYYNGRTGGTGRHIAMSTPGTSGMNWFTSDYNLYVTPDTAAAILFYSAVHDFTGFRGASGGDRYSLSEASADLPAASLFNNAAAGDLSIVTTNPNCWYVNGKGRAAFNHGVVDDYDADNVRSNADKFASDIGADEFTTNTSPPAAVASAMPANNSTTVYTFGKQLMASVTWGSGGTAPDSLTLRFYTGENPPGTLAGYYSNWHANATASGGSGYSYDITFNYSHAWLGTITSMPNIRLAKRDATVWNYLSTSAVNTTNSTVTMTGLTSFSDFALTDAANPLPVELVAFTAGFRGSAVHLFWRTASELNTMRFEIERLDAGVWTRIGEVSARGSVDTPGDYSFVDERPVQADEHAYRLKIVNRDGGFEYSTELRIASVAADDFRIHAIHPNPFTFSTTVSFVIPAERYVTARVLDAAGREVETLHRGPLPAGVHSMSFPSRGLPAGVYTCVVTADDESRAIRMVLAR